MDGKLVALCPVSTDTSRLRQDVNVVLCQDTSENESTNYLCKTKPVAESSLQELKSSSATDWVESGSTFPPLGCASWWVGASHSKHILPPVSIRQELPRGSPYYSGNTGFEVTLLQCHLAFVFPEWWELPQQWWDAPMVLATAITKTEEVGWDPNHLILPSQSSYLHQDNLALRSTCYVLDHIGFITSLLLVLTMSVTSTLITLGARSYHLTK
ncbi:hypothetical protein Pcinc_023277 [Petrolisthes cinctipes]|uniref:Uncharacterized protein n=1 Tax=Petrolisthes cinctipes TaxID=88211 RepID=A0AAE1FCD2_PETCI|nr:hypothetical protein Pcinc_023277 [Petrolisthes cinctipes]